MMAAMTATEFQQMWVGLERLITAITDEAEVMPDSVLRATKALCEVIVATAERKQAFEA